MRDPRIDRLADVLVHYSARVKRGDVVGIMAEPEALPLVEALGEAIIKAGGDPVWMLRTTHFSESLLRYGTPEQVTRCHPVHLHYAETIDVHFSLWSDANTKSLSRFEPAKLALLQQARKPFISTTMQRAAEGKMRWCGTVFPTHGHAQDAEMSLSQYEEFVYGAGLLHLPDPAGAWRKIEDRQKQVCDFLNGKKMLRFRAPARDGHDGTDLMVDVSRATWQNCAGRENFPDGEVFAGPTMPPGGFGVDGHVNYTFPAVYQGREVHGVRLKFRGGRVVDATASKGEDFLIKMLDQDDGARNMGEIAIGTNYSITDFSNNTLFDEKIGGTFHAAVGAGYPESGNANTSGLHWDMVCDLRPARGIPGGTIEADGEVFHRDGKFVKEGWPGN